MAVKNSVQVIYDMEQKLLDEIIKFVKKGSSDDIDIAEFKARKLAQLGTVRNLSEKIIEKDLNLAIKLAVKEIRERGENEIKTINGKGKLVDALPVKADERLKAVWRRYENEARDRLYRLNAKLLQGVSSTYVDIVEISIAEVLAGQNTLRDAIRKIAFQFTRKGIKVMRDSRGRQLSNEAYAQMVVRSSIRKVTTDTSLEVAKNLDTDLVEVSSHLGARPLCAPYQGKIYSLSGSSSIYPALSSTSYGEPAGLFGINCGHRMYPWIPAMGRTYFPYPKKINDKVYELSQQQRANERAIRNAKKNLDLAKRSGDKAKIKRSNETLINRKEKMKEFISKTGRTRRLDREEIYV